MARRCTTVPGYGVCCRAAGAGQLGTPVVIKTQHGSRCGQCDLITKRNGSQGFRFRFHKSSVCGLGPGGCPNIGGASAGQSQMQLPSY